MELRVVPHLEPRRHPHALHNSLREHLRQAEGRHAEPSAAPTDTRRRDLRSYQQCFGRRQARRLPPDAWAHRTRTMDRNLVQMT